MPDEVTPLKSYGRCRRVLGLTNVLPVVSITRMRELVMLTPSLRMMIWIKSRFCQLEWFSLLFVRCSRLIRIAVVLIYTYLFYVMFWCDLDHLGLGFMYEVYAFYDMDAIIFYYLMSLWKIRFLVPIFALYIIHILVDESCGFVIGIPSVLPMISVWGLIQYLFYFERLGFLIGLMSG